MSVPLRRTASNMFGDRPVYDMPMPFNPNHLKRNAQAQGLSRRDADMFAHMALQELRELHAKSEGKPITALQMVEAIRQHAAREVEVEAERQKAAEQEMQIRGITIWDEIEMDAQMGVDPIDMLKDLDKVKISEEETDGKRAKRFRFTDDGLDEYFGKTDPYASVENCMSNLSLKHNGHDIITGLCQHVELAVELGKHLRPEDIVSLYRANRAFNNSVSGYILSSIRSWITYQAPEAGRIFTFKLYRKHLIPDPAGRTWNDQIQGKPWARRSQYQDVRSVPGLKYLQLVLGRDRSCREIIAMMARNGHRMPPTMYSTLLRLWLLMDISTSGQRQALLRNKQFWTNRDLYNAQFLFVKLGLHFNDPTYGPNSLDLLHLMMGQKGLYPLWQLLMRKRFTKLSEALELRVRYDFEVPPDHWGSNYFDRTVHGVPYDEVGIGHLESWGLGDAHLLRPDELIPLEAVSRSLDLDEHITHMMLWGYFDWQTGENIVPTEEEIYISDDEKVLAHMDTTHHWKHKHTLKKRFNELSPEQQQQIIEDDEDDRLRAMAWCGENIDDYHSDGEERPYSLDDEINRGYIVNPQPRDQTSEVPQLDDGSSWANFVNAALIGATPDVNEEEALQAEAWQSYHEEETDTAWDWNVWMEQEDRDTGDWPLDDNTTVPSSSSTEESCSEDDIEMSDGDDVESE